MNSKAYKHIKEPKKVFFTQREMRRFRLENQIYELGRTNPTSNNYFLSQEILCGPSGSGVPSHRICHRRRK